MLKNEGILHMQEEMKCRVCDGNSVRGILLDIREQHLSVRQVQVEGNASVSGVHVCRGFGLQDVKPLLDQAPSSVSHRCAVSFDRLLQVVIVGQNLHEEVELQSLRLGLFALHAPDAV